MQYAGDPLESTPADGTRQAVFAMVKENPDITHAIQDKAAYELRISKDRYDRLTILQMIEEQTGGQDAKA
jgi:hypothetical protein